MRVAIHTLGCKVNQVDSEAIIHVLKRSGYEIVSFKEIADVYIINTCTVTNESDRKSRQHIRKAIKQNSDAIVVVTGCYSQVSPDEVKLIDGVDIIVGTDQKEKLPNMIENARIDRNITVSVSDLFNSPTFEHMKVESYHKRTRAFYKLQEGCNNFCTYCIIPYARGDIRSANPKVVLEDINDLVISGHKEIVLTGIHTGAYGRDLENYTLAKLIRDIEKIPNPPKRIRLSSIEINELDDELLTAIKNSKIFAKHLHIPLQSGSNKILELMNRKYLKEEFVEKVKEIKDILGDVVITTDLIVGFPGESDEDFKESLEVIKNVGFYNVHVFPYSKREGTPASKMENQIPKFIKQTRVAEVISLSEQLMINENSKYLNCDLDLIIEEQLSENLYVGHSSEYIKVKVNSNQDIIGESIVISPKKVDGKNLFGDYN